MKDDVLPRQQRVLDLRQRLVQLALPISLRARVHPHAIYLAFRSIRWVIEVLARVCALHNEPHLPRMFFPPLLALHLAPLREYHFPASWLIAEKGVELRRPLPLLENKSRVHCVWGWLLAAGRGGALNGSVAPIPCQPKHLYACCLHLLVSALALKSHTAKSQTYSDFQEAAAPATAAATATPYTET